MRYIVTLNFIALFVLLAAICLACRAADGMREAVRQRDELLQTVYTIAKQRDKAIEIAHQSILQRDDAIATGKRALTCLKILSPEIEGPPTYEEVQELKKSTQPTQPK